MFPTFAGDTRYLGKMATKTPFDQLYLSMHGTWKAGTPWVGEVAQIGLRCTFHLKASTPVLGETFTVPTHLNSTPATATKSGTHGTLTQSFEASVGVGAAVEDHLDADAQIALAEAFHGFADANKAFHSLSYNWTHVKLGLQQRSGKYSQHSSVYQFTAPLAGTGPVDKTMPPEVAICASLRAPILGRRGRGRMYLPGLIMPTGASNGVVLPTWQSAINTNTKALIDAIQALWSPAGLHFCLVTVTSAGAALGVRPSEARVGSHWDVQQRRQDQAPETYVTLGL